MTDAVNVNGGGSMIQNCYWNETGNYQFLYSKLATMIPFSGSVPNARKNQKLERLRRAANCYYDLYNNGLCNRRSEFYKLFQIKVSEFKTGRDIDVDRISHVVEPIMDKFIMDAAFEQRIVEPKYK